MEIKVRQSWNQIMLGEYLRYRDILKDEFKTEFQKRLETVALMANIDQKWLLRVPANQFTKLFEMLKFLEEEPKGPILEEYQLNGRKYRVASRIEDVTTGQFIDLHSFCKGKTPEQLIDLSADVIACVLVPYEGPIGADDNVGWKPKPKLEKYLETPHAETAEAVLNFMPVTEALGISNFFTLLLLGYCKAIVNYSENPKKNL